MVRVRGKVTWLLTHLLGILLSCLVTYLPAGSTGATPERLTELFVAKDVNGSRSLDMQAL